MIRLFQAIKQAYISVVHADSGDYPTAQATHNGKATSVVRLSPYGLCTNPPEESLALLLSSNAQESTKFAIIDDMPNRFKNLAEGEVVLYNYNSKSYYYLKANGDIEIVGKKDLNVTIDGDATVDVTGDLEATAATAKIISPTITLAGNVVITGTLSTTGSSTLTGGATIGGLNFGSHVHGSVQTGTGVSGGPQ